MAGVFFIVPLFLSVVLGLSPIETGLRLLPLALAMLLAAAGIPRFLPQASPQRVVRLGLLGLIVGILVLIGSLEVGADSSIVFVPMIIVGFGLGALASQLGAVTVSAVPTEQSSEVGGLQNTASQLGSSIGTALAGSVLIAALTVSFLTGIEQNPNVPEEVKTQASVNLAAGAPFVSHGDVEALMAEAGASAELTAEVVEQNEASQIDGLRAALAVLAVMAIVALFFTGESEAATGFAAGNGSVGRSTRSDPWGRPAGSWRSIDAAVTPLRTSLRGVVHDRLPADAEVLDQKTHECAFYPGVLAAGSWELTAKLWRTPSLPANKAEGAGFEPARPCGLPVFKTGAINQTPPPLRVLAARPPGRASLVGTARRGR